MRLQVSFEKSFCFYFCYQSQVNHVIARYFLRKIQQSQILNFLLYSPLDVNHLRLHSAAISGFLPVCCPFPICMLRTLSLCSLFVI